MVRGRKLSNSLDDWADLMGWSRLPHSIPDREELKNAALTGKLSPKLDHEIALVSLDFLTF